MANVAHFCLQKLHMMPRQLYDLPPNERAFVIASVSLRIQDEIKQQKEMNNKRGRKR